MDYYTVHDDVNGQLGFVPHSSSSKSAPIWGRRPGRVFDEVNFEPFEDDGEGKIGLVEDQEERQDDRVIEDGWWDSLSRNQKIIFVVLVLIVLGSGSA